MRRPSLISLVLSQCSKSRSCHRRGYAQKKLTENVDAEIMQVVLDEVKEAYREEVVVELRSESIEDLESNIQRAVQWINQWCTSNAGVVS